MLHFSILMLILVGLSHQMLYDECYKEFCLPGFCCNCADWDKCNVYILIGDYLNLTCTLSDDKIAEGINSSQIFISYGQGINISTAEAFILNDAALGFSKLVSGLQQEGPYRCRFKSGRQFAATEVTLEYPPHRVENFTCIIYNWDERMECSWDLGLYSNMKTIDVTLSLDSGYCPHQEPHKCTWKKSDGISFDRSVLNFTINVTNKRTKDFKLTEIPLIGPDNYVKPNPVDVFDVETINGTCVFLKWQHSKLNHSLLFTLSWNYSKAATNNTELTVCDLRPVTEYEFFITTWPGKGQGHPSRAVNNSITTDYDKTYGDDHTTMSLKSLR